MAQNETDPDCLCTVGPPRPGTCRKFRRGQDEPQMRRNRMKFTGIRSFFLTYNLTLSYDSTNSWPGVVKAATANEVRLTFSWAWLGGKDVNKLGGGKDGGRKLSVGVRQGPGGQSIRPPKSHLGLERTDLASVTDGSWNFSYYKSNTCSL